MNKCPELKTMRSLIWACVLAFFHHLLKIVFCYDTFTSWWRCFKLCRKREENKQNENDCFCTISSERIDGTEQTTRFKTLKQRVQEGNREREKEKRKTCVGACERKWKKQCWTAVSKRQVEQKEDEKEKDRLAKPEMDGEEMQKKRSPMNPKPSNTRKKTDLKILQTKMKTNKNTI